MEQELGLKNLGSMLHILMTIPVNYSQSTLVNQVYSTCILTLCLGSLPLRNESNLPIATYTWVYRL